MADLLLRCLCGYHAVIPVALMVYGYYELQIPCSKWTLERANRSNSQVQVKA